MSHPSVCIIGAGACGLATAVHLAERGITDVTVLEAEHPAAGSSGLSVGVIETQYVDPLDIALRVRAIRFFSELERDHGLDVNHIGYLRLSHDAETTRGFHESVRLQHELGVADAAVLDRQQMAELVPDMDVSDLEAGLWGPSDGFIDGHLYCSLLADLASARGVQVLGRHKLLGHRTTAGGGHVLETERGEHTCDLVVNAAGAWAPSVAAILGVSMPLSPQRHQAVVVHLPEPLPYTMPMVMDYTPHSGAAGVFFRHERPGQLIAGLHSEEAHEEVADPDVYARSADPDFIEGVAETLSKRLPTLTEAGLAHGWAGLYPVSSDGRPQVGPHDEAPTILAAGGAGGSGIQLSPVIAELVADWIEHGEPRAIAEARSLLPSRPPLAETNLR